jgi:hypothetical protein
MVNLDLRELSAPVEALRLDLKAAYERLDSKWNEVVKIFKSLPIPTSVSFTFENHEWSPEDCKCLVWKKWNGKKRICIESHVYNHGSCQYSDYDVTTTPYEEWSGQQRIDMLEHVPSLFAAAEEATRAFIVNALK